MKVAVFQILREKKQVDKVELSDACNFAIEPNSCFYWMFKQYLAHQRQGTAQIQERAEIAGR